MSTTTKDPNKITLTNVILSYPCVFTAKKVNDQGTPKFSAAFILDKKTNAKDIKLLKEGIERVRKNKPLNGVKLPADMICLKEGATKLEKADEYPEGYSEDVMFINTNNPKRPTIVDRDKTTLSEGDDKIYGGLVVNAIIRLWGQNNRFGKRVNASLEGVQRVGNGTRYGAPPLDPEEFPEMSGTDEESAEEM